MEDAFQRPLADIDMLDAAEGHHGIGAEDHAAGHAQPFSGE